VRGTYSKDPGLFVAPHVTCLRNRMVAAALQDGSRLCEPRVTLRREVSQACGCPRRKKDKSECRATRIAGNPCRESGFPISPRGSARGFSVFAFDLFVLTSFRIAGLCQHLNHRNSPGSVQTVRDRKEFRERFLPAQFFREVPVLIIPARDDGKRDCSPRGQTKHAWSRCSPPCTRSRNNNYHKNPTSLDLCECD